MGYNLERKLPGSLVTADEYNIIIGALDDLATKVTQPSHSFNDVNFVVTGSENVGGVVVPIISLVDGSGNPGTPLTREQLLIILGVIPPENLPASYFSGMTGSGTLLDPWVPGGTGSGNISESLKALPGYVEGTEKILYGGGTTLGWGPVPSGSLEKLSPMVVTKGNASVNSIPFSWPAVTDATRYLAERADNVSFVGAVQVKNDAALSFAESGLTANTTYYYRFRAAASGFASSDWVVLSGTTLASGNVTPAAPTLGVVNNTNKTFNWTNNSAYPLLSDYEYTLNAGTNVAAVTAKPISVGNVNLGVGQVGVRVKAATGRDASPWLFNLEAFTVILITPPAPTNPIVNDDADTFTVTPPTGYVATDLETSVNGGSTYTDNTTASFFVDNVALAVGAVRTRVKAASGRNAGPYVSNATAFTVSTPKYMVGFTAMDLSNGLVDKTGTVNNNGIWTTPPANDQTYTTKYTMPHLSEYAFKVSGAPSDNFEMKLASSYSITSGADGVMMEGGVLKVNRNGTIEVITTPQQPVAGDFVIVRYVGDSSTPFANRELLIFKSSDAGVTYTPITITERILYVNAPNGFIMVNIGYGNKTISYPQGKGLVVSTTV